ncbi:MAG: heme-binding protein [Pseudomonadales bacterium]|nr:heme-binding protein [Pseudomonadales bacterium]
MKHFALAVLSLSALVCAGAQAQVTTQRESIAYEGAKQIVETCEAMAKERNWPIAIWVLDITGQPLYFAATNGVTQIGIETAQMKARTALLTGAPSEARASSMENPIGQLSTNKLGLFPIAGGIPLLKDGKVIGAVGAGGGRPENGKSVDQICAQAGIDAVFKQ